MRTERSVHFRCVKRKLRCDLPRTVEIVHDKYLLVSLPNIINTDWKSIDRIRVQAFVEADQKFCGISHRAGLFDGKNIRRFETGPTNWNDERLSQLSDHVAGGHISNIRDLSRRYRPP